MSVGSELGFPQGLKPAPYKAQGGTAEAVPSQIIYEIASSLRPDFRTACSASRICGS
jgi:hypothetical protein